MRLLEGKLRLSASDLANHLGCRHLTVLDLAAAHGRLEPPRFHDPGLDVLQQRGFEHEAQYLEHLRGLGMGVVEVSAEGAGSAALATLAAMRSGADVIVQATLASNEWFGRADILQRVPVASELGDWSYEVTDTKLARDTRAGTILQLCLYSDIVGQVQGRVPEFMHVVSPDTDFKPETFRVHDYLAYYRFVQGRLSASVVPEQELSDGPYPDPVPQCDICRWWSSCDKRRRKDDHLSLVAGISKLQRRELGSWGVESLAQLAKLPLPLAHKPSRGAADGFVRVREQARVQWEGREQKRPVHELLAREPERGLARLPEPNRGDFFFDIEGDPFAGTGGLEYLFGWVAFGDDGGPTYRSRWATSRGQEKALFEHFIDEVMKAWASHPGMHVYHFAPYEPGAIKRLMGRYATREEEVDRLLRAEVFVDLYSITKQSLRASVERYSIKDLEQFYGYEREVELREASKNLHAFERALELGQVDAAGEEIRSAVEGYNRDDCVSTLHLRNWLEGLRAEVALGGEEIARPALKDGAAPENVDERRERVAELMQRLLEGVPVDREERSAEQHANWLLAYMLNWHRREAKVEWWEWYRLCDLGDEEFLDESAGLAGLEFVELAGGSDTCPIHRYRFPPQESDLKDGDSLYQVGGEPLGSVATIDAKGGTIDIKKSKEAADAHPAAVFTHSSIRCDQQADALFRLGEWVAANGVDAPGLHRAARDLLLGRAPRLSAASGDGAPLQAAGETGVAAARRLGLALEGGVLAIQGPPGAGKTYTGARMIYELVAAGKTVGITAGSHKVIRTLLDGVVQAASKKRTSIRCLQKVSGAAAKDEGQAIVETTQNPRMVKELAKGKFKVLAGTAWLWAREDVEQTVDVLFVDEAGQMSLANVLAVAQAARNVVLLGDPQQLDQPLKGSHPEGTEVSALQHLLGAAHTIPADRGLFLAETWRLHPSICALTSELFYEGRLQSRPDLRRQALSGDSVFVGAGLWFVPVEHEGNQNRSAEEVERVVTLYARLTSGEMSWTDRSGQQAPITEEDVLIVAPYNAHVGALGERLPGARIGTVDKFQGQEAPIVIYSMATSSPEEAPRGMEFLFSLNRLNVATSRARCACILVASPRLFEPECRTPRQAQLANAFCRYLELAKRFESAWNDAPSGPRPTPEPQNHGASRLPPTDPPVPMSQTSPKQVNIRFNASSVDDEWRPELRPALKGEWTDIETDLSVDDLNKLAHLLNGYEIAEDHLGRKASDLRDELRERHRTTGLWEGTAVELLAGFFAAVRGWRGLYSFPEDGDEYHREALGLFRAVQDRLRSHPGEVSFTRAAPRSSR